MNVVGFSSSSYSEDVCNLRRNPKTDSQIQYEKNSNEVLNDPKASIINDVLAEISEAYTEKNFEAIFNNVNDLVPEFWISYANLEFFLAKLQYFEFIKTSNQEAADKFYYEKIVWYTENMSSEYKDKKSQIFSYLKGKKDLLNSDIFSRKSKVYFDLFVDIFKVFAEHTFLNLDENTYQTKINELGANFNDYEDLEESIYLNDIELTINNKLTSRETDQNPYNLLKTHEINNLSIPKRKSSIHRNYFKQSNIFGNKSSFSCNDGHMDIDDNLCRAKSFRNSFLLEPIAGTCVFNDASAKAYNINDYSLLKLGNEINLNKNCSGSTNYLSLITRKSNESKLSVDSFTEVIESYGDSHSLEKEFTTQASDKQEVETANHIHSLKAPKKVFNIDKEDKELKIIETLKERLNIPFLRTFNPRLIKREEVDKKIIRKFRKFLKTKIMTRKFNEYHPNFEFWKTFTFTNMMAPFTYYYKKETLEFKSFNWNYICWFHSRTGARDLFEQFLKEKRGEILSYLRKKANGDLKGYRGLEFNQLVEYIENYCDIYNLSTIETFDYEFKCVKDSDNKSLNLQFSNSDLKKSSSNLKVKRTKLGKRGQKSDLESKLSREDPFIKPEENSTRLNCSLYQQHSKEDDIFSRKNSISKVENIQRSDSTQTMLSRGMLEKNQSSTSFDIFENNHKVRHPQRIENLDLKPMDSCSDFARKISSFYGCSSVFN